MTTGLAVELAVIIPSVAGSTPAVEEFAATPNQTSPVACCMSDRPPESGTPLNPTQQIVTQEQGNFLGYDPERRPESYARSTQGQDRGMER